MEQRDFKGIWIPKEIYLSTELNWTDKILLLEIDSLDNDGHCFASNEYFADFLGISIVSVSKSINKLKELGYIEQVSFNGRERRLKSNLKADLKQTLRQTLSELKVCNKENFKDNNISNKNTDNKYISSFEEFWKEYPKQRAGNKQKSYKAYCRVIKEKRADEKTLLESAKKYALSEEVAKGYAKGCEAWLNDDRFNVEYKKIQLNEPEQKRTVKIELGTFYLDNLMPEYKDVTIGMTDEQCERLWKWIYDKYLGQELEIDSIRAIIKKYNKRSGVSDDDNR